MENVPPKCSSVNKDQKGGLCGWSFACWTLQFSISDQSEGWIMWLCTFTLGCSFSEINPVKICVWKSVCQSYNFMLCYLLFVFFTLSIIYFPPKTYSRNGFYWENTLLYCKWRWQSLPPRGLFPLPCSINSLCFGLALPSLKIPLRLYPISYFKSQPG